MSFHQARCKSTLSELILIFQDLFSWVENFFGCSRNFFTGRVFLRVEFFVWPVENFLHWSRNFFVGREIFLSVEKFFCRSKIFWPVESVFRGREVFWSVDREKSEKLDEKFLWTARFSRQNVVCVKVRRIAFVSFGMKWEIGRAHV